MANILELNNVSKSYKKSNFILNNCSIAVPYGSIMGFVGENGAGKTTTIGCILGALFKDSGTIKFCGKELSDSNNEVWEDIGVVYDGDNFPNYLSAVQLANIMHSVYKKWDDVLFLEYLNKFHLPKEQKIKSYSKGMTMKLAIATALSHHPKLLILDEATSGLDPVMRDEILDVFLDFVGDEEHSIFLSSHITSDLEKVADNITLINNGKIILTASKDDLIYNYSIMRCKTSQFETIDPNDILAYRKKDYQIDVLVNNYEEAHKKYNDFIIDHTTIDEIMLLLIKGGIQ